MKTTKNGTGIPRILVKISNESKMKLVEKEIISTTGEKFKLCLKAPSYLEIDKYEISVRVGEVIGVSPGVEGIEIGDLVLLDYIVDAEVDYMVRMEGLDKIVSVPCASRIHDKDIIVTMYYQAEQRDPNDETPPKMIYIGEKNVMVAKKGDVDEISLVLAVVRGEEIIPNKFYVFCEQRPEMSGLVLQANGLFGYAEKEETHIRRKVLFADPSTGLKSGDYILAMLESNYETILVDKKFDVIPVVDILAKD